MQFNHRVLAILSVLLVLALWWRTRGQGGEEERRWAGWLLAAALLQTALGIATLLLYAPVWLAALHQAGAMLLVTAAVLHAAARRRARNP